MLDKVKPLSQNDQMILQQLINNLTQHNDQNPINETDSYEHNRSETPSTNNDIELAESGQDESHSSEIVNGNFAAEMARQLQFVGHQIVKLIYGMGQEPCTCSNCSHQLKKNVPSIHNKNGNDTNLNISSQLAKVNNGSTNSVGIPEFNEDGSLKRGRKSKYCSASEKQAVADYADLHGATAAARKFDIPASVAAYYHRKLKKGSTGPGASVSRKTFGMYPAGGESKTVHESRQHSLDTNGEENENQRSLTLNEDLSRGTSGVFLRGRGRGRPKLIGDELDAELVEYMVNVKSTLPRAHLTASHALDLARNYIKDKAPHILEENGGHIHLKITWAMKLVTRTNERWRELNGGPPSPFDSNNSSLLQINNQLNEFIKQLNETGQNGATSELSNIQELEFPFSMKTDQKGQVNTENSIKTEFVNNEIDPLVAE